VNFGIEYIWDLCQDTSKIDCNIFNNAVEAFQTLIKDVNHKQLRDDYLTKCFENVKKGISVPQSLLISYSILTTFN
jgi:hypothetical protein